MKLRMASSSLIAAIWLSMMGWSYAAYAAEELADGTYTANYFVLKAENDAVSMANDYWEKPATVTVSEGKATVRLMINHSEWVTEFKVPSGSSYTNVKVVSDDKLENKRLVEFAADITNPIMSKIHVTVPEIDYDHDYTIRLVFDNDSFKLIQAAGMDSTSAPAAKPTATLVPSVAPAAKAPSAAMKPETAAPEVTLPLEPTVKPNASAAASAKPADAKPAKAAQETAAAVKEMESANKPDAAVEEAAATATEAPAVFASPGAASVAEAPKEESKSSSLNWWAPIGAALLLSGGGFVIWKRRKL